MKAACWHGPRRIAIERVPDPELCNPRDVLVRVRATTLGGSDLHLYDGVIPSMLPGDIMGHEFVGEVVARGDEIESLELGARVAVCSSIACGRCAHCEREQFSLCDNGNPNAGAAERALGYAPGAMFGHSHLLGGYAGSFAEYVRVPFADVGCIALPPEVSDEAALFLGDAVPTAYAAVELAGLARGDVLAVWGCGAVGLLTLALARAVGAERLIAIDRDPERLRIAQTHGAHALDASYDISEDLAELTGGRGPDACIDAVGMEARGLTLRDRVERAKSRAHLAHDCGAVLRDMIHACRKGGTVVIAGTYAGHLDHFPIGLATSKQLTLRTARPNAPKYARLALQRVAEGSLDPRFLITARRSLDDIAHAFAEHDRGVRTVLHP